MILKTRDKREVDVTEISFGSEIEDTYIAKAYYIDTDGEAGLVPDDVLEELQNDYGDKLDEAWFENRVGAAEANYDAMEDR